MTSTRVRPVTVLCVDDQPCFRDALRGLIVATPGLTQIGEVASGEDAIRAVAALEPDIVLIDVRMPGLNGFQTAAIVSARNRDTFVILISADATELPLGFASHVGRLALVSKQDLSPQLLLDVWHGRTTH